MPRLMVNSPECEVMILSESSSDEAPGCSLTSVQKKRVNIAPVFLRGRKKRRCEPETRQPEPRQPEPLPRSPARGCRLRTPPAGTDCAEVPPPPSAALLSCLDGIQTSNPSFPVRAAFSSLQRRARSHEDVSEQLVSEKRRLKNEISPRALKSLRTSSSAPGVDDRCGLSVQEVHWPPGPPDLKRPRSSRLSRSRRLKVGSQISAGTNHTESDEQTPKTSDSFQKVPYTEDRLWTEKYSPQHSSEVIGNSEPLAKLHSWLRRWKSRADRDDGRQTEDKKEENSNDCWDCGAFQGEAGSDGESEERLSTAMLITGPPGVGKTASVYACAQEFGFKVFEVNCASQRSGRRLLSQLKEATQSHLVEASGKDPLKPAYINSYNTSSAPKPEPLPGRAAMPLPRRRAVRRSRCSAGKVKTKPATTNLARYFKMKAKADRCHFGGPPPPEHTDTNGLEDSSLPSDQTPPQRKKTATSLVLFEEVHVIFDDDVGFLAAVKTFMATTKRPVVLTTNDPAFRQRFHSSLEEIVYKPPSAASACSYLQLVCLAEGVRVEAEDVDLLLTLSGGDVRRCLLQLQLWVQSRGGAQDVDVSDGSDLQLLSGCSAFMLGLQPATLDFLLHHLKCPSWPETELNQLLSLLAESWRRRQPLLYANLEILLDSVRLCGPPTEKLLIQDDVRIGPNSPMQHVGNLSKLSQRKNSLSVCDDSSLSNLSHKPGRTSLSVSGTSRVSAERRAARVVTDCLDSLADFFHLMSSLDAVGKLAAEPEALVWTGAELKDGLLDEETEEEGSRSQEGLLLDVQAAVEGLGCRRCFRRLCEAWTEAQSCRRQLEEQRWKSLTDSLAANGSSKRTRLRLSAPPLCAPSVCQRRLELSRTVLSGEYFSLLGNREAVGLDYMPLLRFICRSHKARLDQQSTRCRNYLSRKHLGLSQSTLQLLAEDF